jgi:hypothetical protein
VIPHAVSILQRAVIMASKTASARASARSTNSAGPDRARRKFLRYFPGGFRDPTYVEWERDYKQRAHERWLESIDRREMRASIAANRGFDVAALAAQIEARTNLLFSFEKMALRDAIRSRSGARAFANGLWEWLYGSGSPQRRFERWCDTIARLPRRGTRVFTWPVVTVFGFIARPSEHMFLKPNVTRIAARRYGFDFEYASVPSWPVYASLLEFARTVRRDVMDLRPRDQIDIQSFLWVQGSDEYPG